ncbi:Uncharacterised protein [Shigella sonnei]|nr:Uncharacterised protein [Shigella sonnei]
MFIFGDPITKATHRAQIMAFDQIIQLLLHFRFTQIHDRFTVRFLITGRDYTID